MARASITDPREYRRGMILGLTLAEVMLLLVFLLLLAAAALVERTRRELAASSPSAEPLGPAGRPGAAAEPLPRDLAEPGRKKGEPSWLQPPATPHAPAAEPPAELAARLERAERERRRLEQVLVDVRRELEQLRREQVRAQTQHGELEAALAQIKGLAAEAARLRAREEAVRRRAGELEAELQRLRAGTSANADLIVEQFEKLVRRGRELEARNRELEERIRALESERRAGEARLADRGGVLDRELALRMIAGGVYPSCLEENGRPVFLFDIVLLTGGRIVVQDAAPARRQSEEPFSAVERFPRGLPIDVLSFVRATRPLSEWSMRQDPPCRFWIKVRRELPLSAPTSEYLRVIGPLGSAANDHLPFYRVGG